MDLRLAQTVADTEAEGPGRRFAVWVQGCSLGCAGCCNPEMFSPRGGRAVDAAELARQVRQTAGIEGLSVLGGEPFEQAPAVAELCAGVRAAGLSVMVYTGFTLAELRGERAPVEGAEALLAQADLLVDGRFLRARPEARRRWVGSQNQQVHFLTGRYTPADPRFWKENTVELRLDRAGLSVNGWPGASGVLTGRGPR